MFAIIVTLSLLISSADGIDGTCQALDHVLEITDIIGQGVDRARIGPVDHPTERICVIDGIPTADFVVAPVFRSKRW